MTPKTLRRLGELTTDNSGQLVFRLRPAQCATCSAACQRHGVRELVVTSPEQVECTGQPVILGWSHRELSKASLRVYGPPVTGICLAIGVSMLQQFPDSIAALAVFAGAATGMLIARLLEVFWQPFGAPDLSLQRLDQPFNNDE